MAVNTVNQIMPNDTSGVDKFNQSGVKIFGAAGNKTQDFTGYGALSNYLPIAEKYMNQMYSVSEEEQAKEDRIRLGMNMLTFFTQMGAEASKPGATALGAANIAGANTAQQYINQVEAKRARDDKLKSQNFNFSSNSW
jgi:hypothetical protein